ncbi:MAG: DUF4912 domain-containing protein [Bacillota bacterium]
MQLVWLGIAVVLAFIAYVLLSRARPRRRPGRLPLPDTEVAGELDPGLRASPGPAFHELPYRPAAEPWIPRTYGESYIYLLPRDPLCLFCFWELAPELEHHHRQEVGPDYDRGLLVMRIECTDRGRVVLETGVEGPDGSWYFHGARPQRPYRAVIGRRLPGGRFVELLRSAIVVTPPAGPSSILDPAWLPQVLDYDGPSGISSPGLLGEVRP